MLKAWLLDNDKYTERDKDKPEDERADRGKTLHHCRPRA
jgi:hypothetical protein